MGRNFPLSGLLRLRELQENKAAGELAAANKALRGGQATMRKVRENTAQTEQNPVDAATMLAAAAARASTSSMLVELNALVQTLNEKAQHALQLHQHARSDVKALEKLAEKHACELRLEDLGREQALLDDLSSSGSRGRDT
ncbi:hypothetical protein CQ018_01780 [Arthrobacter sp. MYb227]|uniref:flagellar export protein FliJ n=1 Tax=Arthrobacter sp. MYb227 TaxID=1848601 RepID=UPI000CFD3580|nr:flagellar FliJ family protein [Arthrobacter sp. MYb227]PQZ96039.1 hypothetical protein CQ018_01780 [Arthrobacter sp. MYb227]